MTTANDTPDVAAILAQVRAEVHAQRAALADASADDPAQSAIERQLQRSIEQIEITRVISAHWPLSGQTLYERGWIMVHKIVRRFLRWYINPIVDQQNEFNDVVARTLRLLVESHTELRSQVAASAQPDQPPPADVPPAPNPSSVPRVDEPPATGPDQDDDGAVSATSFTALQALVEQRGQNEPPAPLLDTAIRPLLPHLGQRQHVNAHWPLVGRTPPEQIAALAQKLVRRYLRWLVNPIVEQFNAFNGAVTEAAAPLLAADVDLRAELASRRARRKKGTAEMRDWSRHEQSAQADLDSLSPNC